METTPWQMFRKWFHSGKQIMLRLGKDHDKLIKASLMGCEVLQESLKCSKLIHKTTAAAHCSVLAPKLNCYGDMDLM